MFGATKGMAEKGEKWRVSSDTDEWMKTTKIRMKFFWVHIKAVEDFFLLFSFPSSTLPYFLPLLTAILNMSTSAQ